MTSFLFNVSDHVMYRRLADDVWVPGIVEAIDVRSESDGPVYVVALFSHVGPMRVRVRVHALDRLSLVSWTPAEGDDVTFIGYHDPVDGTLTQVLRRPSGHPEAGQVTGYVVTLEDGRTTLCAEPDQLRRRWATSDGRRELLDDMTARASLEEADASPGTGHADRPPTDTRPSTSDGDA